MDRKLRREIEQMVKNEVSSYHYTPVTKKYPSNNRTDVIINMSGSPYSLQLRNIEKAIKEKDLDWWPDDIFNIKGRGWLIVRDRNELVLSTRYVHGIMIQKIEEHLGYYWFQVKPEDFVGNDRFAVQEKINRVYGCDIVKAIEAVGDEKNGQTI